MVNSMDRRKALTLSLGAGGSLVLAGCGGNAVTLANLAPQIDVADVRVLSLGLQGLKLGVDLNATNPNPIPLPVSGVDIGFDLGGIRIGTGSLLNSVMLQPGRATRVPLEVNANLLQLGLNAQRILGASSLPYGITGTARIAGIPIPIPVRKQGVLRLR